VSVKLMVLQKKLRGAGPLLGALSIARKREEDGRQKVSTWRGTFRLGHIHRAVAERAENRASD
jgi:hypothetical protein